LNLATGKLNATPFLNIHSRLTSTSGEQGLLGMAFDPNYTTNGKFYLNFTVPGGTWGNGVTHISQFQVSASNPDVANTSNERILLRFDHPEANHNGGWIGFSPRTGDDHNLYIATGDGGSENDQGIGHIEPGGNAQNNTTLLGKMLRIHVNPVSGTASIPSNNPFFGSSTLRQEIWAFGLRNPWRNSFDRQTGRMFIGDVGGDAREEIDVQQATNPGGGENYEWRLREGKIATPTGGVGGPRPPGGVDPILNYPHSVGQTVIGGYVYRGDQIPALKGTYVFADFLGPESGSQGRIFTLNYDGTKASNFQNITSKLFPTKVGGYVLNNPSSLGQDANRELYITDIGNGNVYKIVPATASAHIDTVRALPDGHAMVGGLGVPFEAYTIEATAGLAPAFSPIGTITAEGDGRFEFEDNYAGNFPERQYRVTHP
jgi:glucose/arabinose dehydrogenase